MPHVNSIVAASLFCSLSVLCSGCGPQNAGGPEVGPEAPIEGSGGMGGAEATGGAPGEQEGEPNELPMCPEFTSGFATEVVDHAFGEGQDFGQDAFPELVLGGPQGGGESQGSLDVVSLGDGGWLTLGFSPRVIVDGPGADFIVFENPFYAGGDPLAPVAELGVVAVSVDGEEWREFPCEPGAMPPYPECAGYTPVIADVTDPESVSPFDPDRAGGEAFDLADLGIEEARFVRITDIEGDDFVFDLDAVSIVNGRCE